MNESHNLAQLLPDASVALCVELCCADLYTALLSV